MIRRLAMIALSSAGLVGCTPRPPALTSVLPPGGEPRAVAQVTLPSIQFAPEVFDAMVAGSTHRVMVALSDGRTVQFDVDAVTRNPGTDVSIRGHLASPAGTVFLGRRRGGVVWGLVDLPGQGRTILRQVSESRAQLSQLDGSAMLRCAFEGGADLGDVNCSSNPASEIRVLLLYDEKVDAVRLNGLVLPMQTLANNILRESQVDASFSIVQTTFFPFVEKGTLKADLADLSAGGTRAQDVLDAKAHANADVVMLIVEEAGGNDDGLSNPLTRPFDKFGPMAISVVTYGAFEGTDAFTHELGHLMGAGHENGPGAFPFSRARVRSSPEMGTIMARGIRTQNIVPLFSNPNVMVPATTTGERTGDSAHDNARTLNLTRGCVENFRP